MILLECAVALRDGDRKKIQEQLAAEIGQPVVLLPSSISRAKERNILFLCDRKACEKCSYPQCRHTPELEHARNFAPAGFTKRTDGVWVTKGWVNFGPHSKQTVTLETWEPVFYLHVEVGGGASVELPGEKHRFWVVRDVFELEGDARPARGQQADFIKVEVRGDDPRFTLRF